jgi:predicted hotdog family 3-hydroxylacyl-ACP dehydratase
MPVSFWGEDGDMEMKVYSVEEVLPHGHPMILIDDVIGHSDAGLTASVTIRQDSHFMRSAGIPSYVGLEYMAQAVAAYGGIEALTEQRPVRIGYLLGTRDLTTKVPFFDVGDRLVIDVSVNYKEAVSSFSCRILIEEFVVVEANLSVYQPKEEER